MKEGRATGQAEPRHDCRWKDVGWFKRSGTGNPNRSSNTECPIRYA
ncbi:MAG: hypothetical protein JMN24_13980 [gamma proteobacterium endosymbiont of Lamellibrachia anaximandri]|nr:hypothetical protein [gamma proteobacterium endosymbiont of Lamellibrachia anaximandri]MBL3617437.1 hypothetical protein [gamma proteobacterium endosymbiont of Lamellibrachia anaximandri]